LSEDAIRLLEEKIKNHSSFIDDLVIDNLGKRDSLLIMLIKKLENLREEFLRINYDLEFDIIKEENKVKAEVIEKEPKKITVTSKEN